MEERGFIIMNLFAVRYSLADRALEIYVSGCHGENGVHCRNCHNPETWDFSAGRPWETYIDSVKESVEKAGDLIQSIRIYGGGPLDQDLASLGAFLGFLAGFGLDLWLFTRRDLEDVPESVLAGLAYVKCGAYDESRPGPVEFFGVSLPTANQRIYKRGVDF